MGNELYHHGVKGMRWGHRRKYYNTDGSLSDKGIKRMSSSTKAKDFVRNQANKRVEKNVQRNEKIKKMTDHFGVGGVAVGAYAETASKTAIKGFLAKTVNSAANSYINSDKGSYYAKQGVHYARRAAIAGLSMSAYADTIRGFSDVGKSYMYATQKRRG